jgi:hypothetical protein
MVAHAQNVREMKTTSSAMGNAATHTHRSDAKAPSLAAELAELGRALRTMLDPYRPERHYMRGPGPKWSAKNNPKRVVSDAAVATCALSLDTQTIEPVTAPLATCSA